MTIGPRAAARTAPCGTATDPWRRPGRASPARGAGAADGAPRARPENADESLLAVLAAPVNCEKHIQLAAAERPDRRLALEPSLALPKCLDFRQEDGRGLGKKGRA